MNTISKFFFIFIYINFSLWGQITVCNNGCIFNDLHTAIHSAPPYSSIIIKDDYQLKEPLIIKKPLTLKGEKDHHKSFPIIDGNHLKNVIYVQNTEKVQIRNLKIQNSGYSDIEEFAGIYLDNVKNCLIENNVIFNNTFGIYLAKTENCSIKKNVLFSFAKDEVQSGNGIHLWYSYNNILEQNIIIGHRDGLYFEYSENLIVKYNKSFNNLRYGIHFMFCHNSQIEHNEFFSNLSGIALMYSKHLHLSYNQFKDSWGKSFKALLLKDINESIISYNSFINNTTAIYTDNSNRNKIYKNKFINNGLALEILGNSYDNEFYENYFENNLFDVSTNSRTNPNKYFENYWDKYKGYDLDKDGYGDIPYKPVSLFSYWVSRYPTLSILIRSPIIDFLELLEKVFPIITPANLIDEKPFIKNPLKDIKNDNNPKS
jgi:nitrous oxidase accessory protein